MKPVAFDYARPTSVGEAVRMLAGTPSSKVLAGGQTLGPMLNLRLAQPALLVDITRIPELAAVSEDADAVTVGATVTHAAIEDGRIPDPTGGFLPRVARGIAYRAVRNRGTIVRGAMETEIAADELLTAIRIPKFARSARFGFHKICRKTGEFADAIGVAVHDAERGTSMLAASSGVGAPVVVDARELRLGSGNLPDAGVLQQRLVAAGLACDAYDLKLHAVAVRRAIAQAFTP
jgi:carbon-monoxide dehydrogenase medium subunit